MNVSVSLDEVRRFAAESDYKVLPVSTELLADSLTPIRVLRILARQDGLSQRALQEGLGIQPGSLSELVTKLEDKGLLTREQDGEDKRRVLLRLTDAGREAAGQAPSPAERDARFAALTEEERDTLRTLLDKLLGGAKKDDAAR